MTKGFTLIEILLTLLIVGMVSAGAIMGLMSMNKFNRVAGARESQQLDLLSIGAFIQRLARSSQSCSKVALGGEMGLECLVDLNIPATGVLTRVRFIRNGTQLEYQKATTLAGLFTVAQVLQTYPNISGFLVCADNDMDLALAGNCPLLPPKLSQKAVDYALTAPTKNNRFFRFAISASRSDGKATTENSYQGALFVRNPTPFPGVIVPW